MLTDSGRHRTTFTNALIAFLITWIPALLALPLAVQAQTEPRRSTS